MPMIQANGVQLYYELHGPEEADVLVLSNGVLMGTASWAFQTPVFSQHCRLLLYDCRGMWQSDHPPGPYSMEMHADDLAALMGNLGIERAHIGGTSYGAEVSMVFGLKYPDRTQSLIITSAVSQIDPLLKCLADTWVDAAEARDAARLFRAVCPLTFSEDWVRSNQATLDLARERYEALDFESFVHLMESFLALDITADLHEIRAPALVVVGEEDILKPRKYSEIIAGEIPDAEFALIPHAGHASMWEQSRVFNTLILGFLAKHRAS